MLLICLVSTPVCHLIKGKGGKPQAGLLRRKALLGHAHRHAMAHPPDGERARGAPAKNYRCALIIETL